MINELYAASKAGVEIDLIVRGICSLRPGVKGLSENIRVRSIIGRFLEHSRIWYFANGGGDDEEVYIGSADLMHRNFDRRVEVTIPVRNTEICTYIRDTILPAYLGTRSTPTSFTRTEATRKLHPRESLGFDSQMFFAGKDTPA